MKKSAIFGIAAFIFVSIIVYTANSDMKVVKFKNQGIALHQESANIKNTNVDISIKDSNIKNESNTKFNNTDLSFDNKEINTQNSDIVDFSNTGETNFENINITANNKHLKRNKYKDIDWSTWKSNFINKFLEDSMYITTLDNYSLGSWFYYSFDVTNKGAIKNIKVFSFSLDVKDKIRVEQLIKSYEYQDITVFPANSKRKSVKLKAIVLLGDTEQKANPYNFNDRERIRISD